MLNRRQALKTTALAAAAVASAPATLIGQAPPPPGPHKLPPLGYGYDALEPHFDARTMEIHHSKHHATYVTKLNEALQDFPDLQKLSIEELLKDLSKVPDKIRGAVRNHGGGHYNHTLFWQCLRKDARPLTDGGPLQEAFGQLWTSGDEAQEQFLKTSTGIFGSGWAWIVVDKDKKLKVTTTANQDCPLSNGETPLIGLDVWEHAYYLKFQNKRADYVKAFYEIINWEFVEERYARILG
jgi:superoxide dismutase, Fe-Mn family